MIQLPWPEDPEREPTPPPDYNAELPGSEVQAAGQTPEEAGRHRAEEPDAPPLSAEQEAEIARRLAIWKEIDTALAEGDAQKLIDISGSDQYDDLMRRAAMTRLEMLGQVRRPTVEIPPKPGRDVGRVAMSEIPYRHAAFGSDRYQLPIIEKNHP